MAPIVRTCKSDVDLQVILDVRAFDEVRAQDLEKSVRAVEEDPSSGCVHVCGCARECLLPSVVPGCLP